MKAYKSEAIVLHSFPSRERDKLVVFLTPERGKVRGFAYGARSMRSRYGASLEPLSKVQLSFYEKESEEAVRIESTQLLRSLFPAQQNLRASVVATYIAESTDVFAQPNEPSQLLFRLVDHCSEALLATMDPRLVVTYFEIWLLRIQGIFPSARDCHECGLPFDGPIYFDERRAGFVGDECATRESEIVARDVREALAGLLRSTLEEFVASAPSRETLFELRALARHLRRHFLGHEMKSYEVMQIVL